MQKRLLIIDCDSTLSAIEGVDELGAFRNLQVKQRVAELTSRAMAGEISIDAVFGERMALIQPTRDECVRVARMYIDAVEPEAKQVLQELRDDGWTPVILSGGFAPVIEPLAEYLGIEQIEAVPLFFDEQGNYAGYGEDYPTTRNGGKPEIILQLKQQHAPVVSVMVGDGVSDLETRPVVDHFIGFGRYAVRERVRSEADSFIYRMGDLPDVLQSIAQSSTESGMLS